MLFHTEINDQESVIAVPLGKEPHYERLRSQNRAVKRPVLELKYRIAFP